MVHIQNLKRELQLFVALVLLGLAVLVPFSTKTASAVPSLSVAMCKTYAITDSLGNKWYKITATYSNYTFTNATMYLNITIFNGTTARHSKTGALTTTKINTSPQYYRHDSSAVAGINTATSGVTTSIPRISSLSNCAI